MAVAPFPIHVKRDNKWITLQTDELVPGDVVSIGMCVAHRLLPICIDYSIVHQQTETTVPADILLVAGTCIVNEAMLSGESTPLLKESIELLEGNEKLDADSTHKSAVLFSGTKVLQARAGGM